MKGFTKIGIIFIAILIIAIFLIFLTTLANAFSFVVPIVNINITANLVQPPNTICGRSYTPTPLSEGHIVFNLSTNKTIAVPSLPLNLAHRFIDASGADASGNVTNARFEIANFSMRNVSRMETVCNPYLETSGNGTYEIGNCTSIEIFVQEEYCNWIPFGLPFTFNANENYYIDLTAKMKPQLINRKIDAIPKILSVEFPFAWWDSNWHLRKGLNITENISIARVNEPVFVNVSGITVSNCTKEIRVTANYSGGEIEIPSQVLAGEGVGNSENLDWCYIVFQANVSNTQSATSVKANVTNFYVYYNNPSATEPTYMSDSMLILSNNTFSTEKDMYISTSKLNVSYHTTCGGIAQCIDVYNYTHHWADGSPGLHQDLALYGWGAISALSNVNEVQTYKLYDGAIMKTLKIVYNVSDTSFSPNATFELSCFANYPYCKFLYNLTINDTTGGANMPSLVGAGHQPSDVNLFNVSSGLWGNFSGAGRYFTENVSIIKGRESSSDGGSKSSGNTIYNINWLDKPIVFPFGEQNWTLDSTFGYEYTNIFGRYLLVPYSVFPIGHYKIEFWFGHSPSVWDESLKYLAYPLHVKIESQEINISILVNSINLNRTYINFTQPINIRTNITNSTPIDVKVDVIFPNKQINITNATMKKIDADRFEWNQTFNATATLEGNWTLVVYANDTIVNATPMSAWLISDVKLPIVNITSNVTTTYVSNSVLIIMNATDANLNVTNATLKIYNPDASLNNSIDVLLNSTYAFNTSLSSAGGNYTFDLYVHDLAGNYNSSSIKVMIGRVQYTVASRLVSLNFTDKPSAWNASTGNATYLTTRLFVNLTSEGNVTAQTRNITLNLTSIWLNWTTFTITNSSGNTVGYEEDSSNKGVVSWTSENLSTDDSRLNYITVITANAINYTATLSTNTYHLIANNFTKGLNLYIRVPLDPTQQFNRLNYKPRYFVCLGTITRPVSATGCSAWSSGVDATYDNRLSNSVSGYEMNLEAESTTSTDTMDKIVFQPNMTDFMMQLNIIIGSYYTISPPSISPPGGSGGSGGESYVAYCGNGLCELSETALSCPADCKAIEFSVIPADFERFFSRGETYTKDFTIANPTDSPITFDVEVTQFENDPSNMWATIIYNNTEDSAMRIRVSPGTTISPGTQTFYVKTIVPNSTQYGFYRYQIVVSSGAQAKQSVAFKLRVSEQLSIIQTVEVIGSKLAGILNTTIFSTKLLGNITVLWFVLIGAIVVILYFAFRSGGSRRKRRLKQ